MKRDPHAGLKELADKAKPYANWWRQEYERQSALTAEYGPPTERTRERWQEAVCPWTRSGICIANCAEACMCARGRYPA